MTLKSTPARGRPWDGSPAGGAPGTGPQPQAAQQGTDIYRNLPVGVSFHNLELVRRDSQKLNLNPSWLMGS